MNISINMVLPDAQYNSLPSDLGPQTQYATPQQQGMKQACMFLGAPCSFRPSAWLQSIPGQSANISLPAVLFVDTDTGVTLAAISGNLTAEKIVEKYQNLTQYRPGELNGESGYFDDTNLFLLPEQVSERESQLGLFGLGLLGPIFDGLKKTPSWIYILIALYLITRNRD